MAPTRTRPPKTVEDYMALPDDVRAELIRGELYVTPAPGWDHQDVVGGIYFALRAYAKRGGAGHAGVSPLDVHLPTGDIVQPDVLFVSQARSAIIQDWIRGAPDLVVEVISPSSGMRDRIVKRDLYAQAGVAGYWIVDPEEQAIEVLALEGAAYRPEAYFRGSAALTTPLLPGFALPLADVFGSA